MTFVRFRGSVFEVLSHFKILPNFSIGLRTSVYFISMNPDVESLEHQAKCTVSFII